MLSNSLHKLCMLYNIVYTKLSLVDCLNVAYTMSEILQCHVQYKFNFMHKKIVRINGCSS